MNRSLARFAACVGVFSLVALVLWCIPAVTALKFNFVGVMGWVSLVLTTIVGMVIGSYASGFCKGFVSTETAANPVVRVLVRAFAYCCFAGLLVTVGKLVPQYVHIVNPVGLYWMLGLMGVGSAVFDMIEQRYFPEN